MVARSLMKKLDFIIIGAQKAGTTTLFKLLSEHPGIHMPLGKEIPFFTQEELYAQGYDAYLTQFFGGAKKDKLWGKATPHYLNDPRAPERIAVTLPGTKLIAILREPAERALSHYRMSVRRGFEQRTFEQAIHDMLDPGDLKRARELQVGPASESQTYIVRGEYGRLLTNYYNRFPRENILVLFTDDLEADPAMVLEKIFNFIGVEPFEPAALGKKFHEGGARERFTFHRNLAQLSPVRRIWKALPPSIRYRIWFWVHQHNLVKQMDSLENYPSSVTRNLRGHYIEDEAVLEALIQREVPWHGQK
jgi:hypothetical protein